jgi:hypothetical protein
VVTRGSIGFLLFLNKGSLLKKGTGSGALDQGLFISMHGEHHAVGKDPAILKDVVFLELVLD